MHILFYACVYIETPAFISVCSVSQWHRSSRSGYDISDIFWWVSHFVSPSSPTGHSCSLCQCVDRVVCLSVSFCVACVWSSGPASLTAVVRTFDFMLIQ